MPSQAEHALSPAVLLWTLLGVLLLVGNVISVWSWISGRTERRRIEPQPLEVAEAERFVTRRELENFQAGIIERLNRIEREIASIRDTDTEDRGELRDFMNQGLARVHERIDDLPSQLIALLRNTGVIK